MVPVATRLSLTGDGGVRFKRGCEVRVAPRNITPVRFGTSTMASRSIITANLKLPTVMVIAMAIPWTELERLAALMAIHIMDIPVI
jgi:hypothetical protein